MLFSENKKQKNHLRLTSYDMKRYNTFPKVEVKDSENK